MIERRQVQRGRTFLGGSIEFGHPGFTIDCVVSDMSTNGAKVIFSDAVPVPKEVDLVIARHGRTHRAHFVWRRGQEAGIVFADAEKQSRIVSLDEARELKSAEINRGKLQARIAQVMRDR